MNLISVKTMNLVEATVIEIVGEPYEKYGKWWVNVVGDCYGRKTESFLMFETEEDARSLKVGTVFLT